MLDLRSRMSTVGSVMTIQHPLAEPEEIEGIGTSEDESLGDYPLDTLLIRNETRTVHDVLRRIDQGMYVMDPDFQREFIWPDYKQSRLIESVLMRIPLPVFYIAENADGKMVVVDGLQRLSTFKNFVDGALRLTLPNQPELHRRYFTDLSPKLQNRVEDCNLTLYVIDSKAPERTRLDIFERVNSGVPLTRQQMRNCLYMGPATQFLKEEAKKNLFVEATGGSLNWAQMRDREFVNRFCGFQLLSLDHYRGDMDGFLAETLSLMNRLEPTELQALSAKIRTGLVNNRNVFGKHAFRKHFEGQEDRNVINASLWDVMLTGLARYKESAVKARADVLRMAFIRLLEENEKFYDAITYGTNQVKRVRQRFESAERMFQEVFGAHPA